MKKRVFLQTYGWPWCWNAWTPDPAQLDAARDANQVLEALAERFQAALTAG